MQSNSVATTFQAVQMFERNTRWSEQNSLEKTNNTKNNDVEINKSSKDKKDKESSQEKLTPQEEAKVAELKAIDLAVRAHEAAHISVGGGAVRGGASFTYVKGPDGQNYAVAGEVAIDTSAEDSPEKTIRKMQQVRAAALAPADPSGQDYKVASTATMLEMRARIELMQEKTEEMSKEQDINSYKEQVNNTKNSQIENTLSLSA